MDPTTDPSASFNGESGRTGVWAIDFATTTLNASSFKGYGAGTSKNRTETGSVIFMSPVVFVAEAVSLYPP